MNRRGCLWFAGGLLLAGVAGVLAFMTLLRASSAPQAAAEMATVQILVAARDIPLHTVLAEADVALREAPPDVVPDDALSDPKAVVGQMAVADMASGEVILRRRLLKPDYVGPRVALVMDPKKVVVAFPATDLLSSIDVVRPGDRVDLMFSIVPIKLMPEMPESPITMMVLQDVGVAGVIRAAAEPNKGVGATGAPRAILVALDPQDALALKYFRDNGGSLDLALRSPAAASGPFDVVPVDGDYIMQRFKLRGG